MYWYIGYDMNDCITHQQAPMAQGVFWTCGPCTLLLSFPSSSWEPGTHRSTSVNREREVSDAERQLHETQHWPCQIITHNGTSNIKIIGISILEKSLSIMYMYLVFSKYQSVIFQLDQVIQQCYHVSCLFLQNVILNTAWSLYRLLYMYHLYVFWKLSWLPSFLIHEMFGKYISIWPCV